MVSTNFSVVQNDSAEESIADFRAKNKELLKSCILFIDDYGWKDELVSTVKWSEQLRVARYIKYLALALGFNLVSAGTTLIDADNNLSIDEGGLSGKYRMNWSTILLKPLPFSIKYLKSSWESDQLQNTFSREIAGDPASKQGLCLFLLEQMSTSRPLVAMKIYEALEKGMLVLEEAKSKNSPIPSVELCLIEHGFGLKT